MSSHNKRSGYAAIQTPLSLLVEEFRQWRSLFHTKRRIPESLWDKVIDLIDQGKYSKNVILSRLAISHDQLSAKLAKRNQAALKSTPVSAKLDTTTPKQSLKITDSAEPSFIRAVIADNSQAQNPAPVTQHDVVITKPNGASLSLKQLSHHDVLLLAKQFAE